MSKEVTEAVVAKIETPAELVREEELQQSNSLVERRAKELKILTNEDYEKAAEFGQKIKIQAKVVTDFFKPMKDSAYKAHKAVCDREKAMLKPLQEAERILKGSIAAYQKEQERKKRELEERMRLEAEAERDEAVKNGRIFRSIRWNEAWYSSSLNCCFYLYVEDIQEGRGVFQG